MFHISSKTIMLKITFYNIILEITIYMFIIFIKVITIKAFFIANIVKIIAKMVYNGMQKIYFATEEAFFWKIA